MRKVFLPIGNARLLDIRVILDDEQIIYEGMVDDAPEEIKGLKYSEVKMGGDKIEYLVYSECN